jgi:hypothetical protein
MTLENIHIGSLEEHHMTFQNIFLEIKAVDKAVGKH